MKGNIITISADECRKLKGREARPMTEEEIVAAANSDPDNPILTWEQLERFQRVVPLKQTTLLSRLKTFFRVQ